jgi:hypothetical protein
LPHLRFSHGWREGSFLDWALADDLNLLTKGNQLWIPLNGLSQQIGQRHWRPSRLRLGVRD